MRKISCACIYILGMLAATSISAREKRVQQVQQVPGRQVVISNAEDQDAAFGLSCDDRKSWQPSTLAAHKRERFECEESQGKMWIHINTDLPGKAHKETEQPLENRGRYELFWNGGDDGKWDVRPV